MKKCFTVVILLWSVGSAYAQFDTDYWMPPIWESQDGGGETSPSELLITTAFPEAYVIVTQSDGTPLYQGTVVPGTPTIVDLTTVQGMTYVANTVEADKGLLVHSDVPVQAVYRLSASNNQCLIPLKGTFGLGTEFRAGTQTRVQERSYGNDDVHFISVMASEHNTEVTITAPAGVTLFGGQNAVTITLDKNETYLVRNAEATNVTNNLAGTHIMSDKPIAAVSGSMHLKHGYGYSADAGIDQIVPIFSDIFEVIGTEYVVVRGSNPGDSVDYAIVIATEDDTRLTIQGNGTTTTKTLQQGEVFDKSIVGSLGTPYYIKADKKIYLYHISGQTTQEVGMSAVPAITCTGSTYLEFSKFVNYNNMVHIMAPDAAFSTMTINGRPYTAFDNAPNVVPGGIGWKTITFYFPVAEDNIVVKSDGFFHLGVIVGLNSDTGTYGYLSGFPKKINVLDPTVQLPTTRYVADTLEQGNTAEHCLSLQSCNDIYRITNVYPSAHSGDIDWETATGETTEMCLHYTAKANHLGNDTIRVDVVNEYNVPGTVELIFHVDGRPVAHDDAPSVDEDGALTGNAMDNDTNLETGEEAELVSSVAHGTLLFNADGSYQYTPDPQWNGIDRFSYRLCDDAETAACDTATVAITVVPVNDEPTAADAGVVTDEDIAYTFTGTDFFADYTDIDGDPAGGIKISGLETAGALLRRGADVALGEVISAADLADGALLFLPESDQYGTSHATFTFQVADTAGGFSTSYTMTVDVREQADAPVSRDHTVTTLEDTDYLFTDTDFSLVEDADGNVFGGIIITGLPEQGILYYDGVAVGAGAVSDETVFTDRSLFRYSPAENGYGAAYTTFGFRMVDDAGDRSIEYGLTVDVTPTNDLPMLVDVNKVVAQGQAVSFTVTDFAEGFTDPDGDILRRIQLISLPAEGTLQLDGVPVAANQEIDIADLTRLVLETLPGFLGTTSFRWNGYDGTTYAAGSAQITINIVVQRPPTLTDVARTTNEDETLALTVADLIAQFYDPDEDALTKIQVTGLPAHGTLYRDGAVVEENEEIEIATLTQLTFVPDAHFNGVTSFRWNGYDGFQYAEREARVDLTVLAVPDAPVLSVVSKVEQEDVSLRFTAADFTQQFSDADGDTLVVIRIARLPAHGALRLNGILVAAGQEIGVAELNQLTFEPTTNFYGITDFAWNGSDGTRYALEAAEVVLTVEAVPDGPPVAAVAVFSTNQGQILSDSLASRVTDPEGTGLVFTAELLAEPAHGTLTLNPDGTFVYLPEASYSGTDTFTYQVCDGSTPAQCTEGTVQITLLPAEEDSDSDGDGIPDEIEQGEDRDHPQDSDGDGQPDYEDSDSDNDGIPDRVEAGADPLRPVDTDQDGIPDFRDTDSDNDGLSDAIEAGADPTRPIDSDGDGIPDFQELDSDGDGLTDTEETGANPEDPRDSDNDGTPDFREKDSDGDGIPDGEDDGLVIYEGFSPNADGSNETWWIEGIDRYPDNTVQIYNRWGNKIYEIRGYNNRDRAWGSTSSMGLVLGDTRVPDGTYFYLIDLGDGSPPRKGFITVHR